MPAATSSIMRKRTVVGAGKPKKLGVMKLSEQAEKAAALNAGARLLFFFFCRKFDEPRDVRRERVGGDAMRSNRYLNRHLHYYLISSAGAAAEEQDGGMPATPSPTVSSASADVVFRHHKYYVLFVI